MKSGDIQFDDSQRLSYLCILLFITASLQSTLNAQTKSFDIEIEQITFGPKHHFFGYIGQSQTIPWNKDERYIVALQTDFHDHMPEPDEEAEIVLIDTEQGNLISQIDRTLAWNFQQGTMFYWNPDSPLTQLFFNDRDPQTGKVFTVLYDVREQKRIREFRFCNTPVGNSGVAQKGGTFLGLNYGRLARLRPVTGYPEAYDWTIGENAPRNDGIFKVNVKTGQINLLVSYKQLADLARLSRPDIDKIPLFINHTLWNRNDDRIYFYIRGNFSDSADRVDIPCSAKPDGTALTLHDLHIGGHPEWAEGSRIIGSSEERQVVYDIDRKKIVGYLGNSKIFPRPRGDISLSPDSNWFVNGFSLKDKNYYVILRRSDDAYIHTPGFSRGSYVSGNLRIDPSPRWNHNNNAILVPGIANDSTRQLYIIHIRE